MALEPLQPIHRLTHTTPSNQPNSVSSGFARILEQVVGGASAADAQATQAVNDLATGEAEDVHSAVLAVAQADLSFRLALELRNRLQEAYQQITQFQV